MSETIILRPRPSSPALAPTLAPRNGKSPPPGRPINPTAKTKCKRRIIRAPTGSTRMAALDPAQPESPLSPPPPRMSEPFDLAATPVAVGAVLTKWQRRRGREFAPTMKSSRIAQAAHDRCPQAARNFLAIVAQGRALSGLARIGVINRAVNMAIEPMSDMAQWGVPDRWSPPLETFTTGRGDCEDYAIAKYVALTAAGVPAAGRQARHRPQYRRQRGPRRRRRTPRRRLDRARQSLADAGQRRRDAHGSLRCSCSTTTACGSSCRRPSPSPSGRRRRPRF